MFLACAYLHTVPLRIGVVLPSIVTCGTEASDRRVVDSLYQQAIAGNPTCIIFWLKNRKPHEWRDVQHLDQAIGHYIISDKPMSEDEWIEARTKAQPRQLEATAADVSQPLS